MLTAFERAIAFRYLSPRRTDGVISVIAMFSLAGIALGVMTLIVVLSVMRGVRGEMIESIIGLEGHVAVYANGRGIPDYDALAAQLLKIDGAKSAIPLVQGQVMASFRGNASGAMITGIRPDDLQYKPLLTKKIVQGDMAAFRQGKGVIIGSRMAERMGLNIGDRLTLISPEGRATPAGMVPRVQSYPVVATFQIGMYAYDNGLVLMPFGAAQTYFMLSTPDGAGMANSIEVLGNSADDASVLAGRIREALGGAFRAYDWKSSNNHLFRAVIVQRNVMFLILMLIILVASFNIISSLIMLVRQKRRDIAILRTMGASRNAILRIFLTTGCMIGVVGTALGVAFGLAIACNTESIQLWLEELTGKKLLADELYFLSSLPAEVDPGEVGMVALMALVLSFLATWLPARRAAKLEPAEVLRGE